MTLTPARLMHLLGLLDELAAECHPTETRIVDDCRTVAARLWADRVAETMAVPS